jgi:hypothetical protein
MLNCPKCDQLISEQAIACPLCGTVLKAYGHPGITLHRATGSTSLCDSCTYHADDTCNFPQRPYAQECTLYHDLSQPLIDPNTTHNQPSGLVSSLRLWCQRNPGLLGLLILSLVSVLLALIATSK